MLVKLKIGDKDALFRIKQNVKTDDIAVCKKVRTESKIEKELKVKKWEQLTQKI